MWSYVFLKSWSDPQKMSWECFWFGRIYFYIISSIGPTRLPNNNTGKTMEDYWSTIEKRKMILKVLFIINVIIILVLINFFFFCNVKLSTSILLHRIVKVHCTIWNSKLFIRIVRSAAKSFFFHLWANDSQGSPFTIIIKSKKKVFFFLML